MRVTGGELRGFSLKSPKGSSTRPMSDRLKLALFSMLEAQGQPRGRVLDLYSGTGALGIESLSRGAEHADFVERNASACGIIRANLAHTRRTSSATVHKRTAIAFLNSLSTDADRYDLILMDPPYADPEIASVIELASRNNVLAPDGLLVLGHTSRREFPDSIGELKLIKKRCHGDSCVSFYAHELP